jgi:hypothetical protein
MRISQVNVYEEHRCKFIEGMEIERVIGVIGLNRDQTLDAQLEHLASSQRNRLA